ncbi:metal-dependent transcriptional regulator [Natrinema thermotolerans]|uniref:Metal-dependent transcriptional regulator n=1 Tax=Natrinema thermotolerans TaxID=121872 RepID=A0AAF0T5C0_9EURY|nr:metal-dependent transcriptional regulator [Natrinema thermotolerans]ELZ09614.1 iron dependent repressor [Natrinema thermotolerans DSM 11552]QCC60189.1 metal-dependent transcriptional regulator [Natrinema thermotolerans]QCC61099.1 metal-dependent transcriptional regulator [Natrinema thermotolerans]WMT07204.1 metal-dependent transcriptional regulator [Natrinema thermotolerans]
MMLSDVMEDYLKAIYQLQRGTDERIRTSEIAGELDVTSPTVTSMLDKLEERELVDREKYRGVTLTDEGETVALEIVRHHRLLEAYLTEHLDYDWSEVHAEADRLEHHISEDFEARVADALGEPTVDPHGSPIPGADLEPPERPAGKAISEFEEGAVVTVAEVADRDPEVLSYLADRGVEPGVELEILEVAPFGMVTARSSESEEPVSLPETVAHHVRVVTPAEPDPQG